MRYTFDLILRENTKIKGAQNENMGRVYHYSNNEPQKIEHSIAALFDKLSRDGFIDRSLYHLANFESKDSDDCETVKYEIDKLVNYLLKVKNITVRKNAGHKHNTHDLDN